MNLQNIILNENGKISRIDWIGNELYHWSPLILWSRIRDKLTSSEIKPQSGSEKLQNLSFIAFQRPSKLTETVEISDVQENQTGKRFCQFSH